MKEFNLSEKIKVLKLDKSGFARIVYVHATDIKEFIKRLKKLLTDGDYYGNRSFTDLFKRIDKLAGDKLIWALNKRFYSGLFLVMYIGLGGRPNLLR